MLVSSAGGRSAHGSHQLQAALNCGRYYDLRYEARLVPKIDKEWRVRGTLVHLALAYYGASKLSTSPSWYRETDLFTALEARGRGWPKLIQRAKEVLAYYIEFDAASPPREPLHVEEEFSATLGELDPGGPDSSLDDIQVTTRPDLMFRRDGLIWDNDYKTVSPAYGRNNTKLETWKDDGEWRLSWQALLGLHIVRRHMPVEGFLIERIKCSYPFDIDRHVITIPAEAYAHAPRLARVAVATERSIVDIKKKGQKPAPTGILTGSCMGRYGECDFWSVCSARTREAALKSLDNDYQQEVHT